MIKDFNVVITDQGISAEYAQDIRAQGPELLTVETESTEWNKSGRVFEQPKFRSGLFELVQHS